MYEAELQRRVAAALAHQPRNWNAMLDAVPGAFPTLVQAVLKEMNVLEAAESTHLPTECLPEPHPVDFEWRFNAETARLLASHITKFGRRICCFGVPTVFKAMNDPSVDVVLLDRNPYLVNQFKPVDHKHALLCDLNTAVSPDLKEFDVLLMDPPWYLEHMESWLENALRVLRSDGVLITTLFPELTRPTARGERREFTELLSSIGTVTFPNIRPRYETPLFESEVLGMSGLCLPHWRTADLVEVQLMGTGPSRPFRHVSEPSWRRFKFGSQIVAIREDRTDASTRLHASPCTDDGRLLLKTVSARDPARERIGLWTSRNRCLRLEGRERLLPFLAQLEAGENPAELLRHMPANDSERRAMEFVLAVIGW